MKLVGRNCLTGMVVIDNSQALLHTNVQCLLPHTHSETVLDTGEQEEDITYAPPGRRAISTNNICPTRLENNKHCHLRPDQAREQ